MLKLNAHPIEWKHLQERLCAPTPATLVHRHRCAERTATRRHPLDLSDDAYFDEEDTAPAHRFDEGLLQAPISVLSRRIPMVFTEGDSVQTAVRAMQAEHRGVVLISEDGTRQSKLTGIFTENDLVSRCGGREGEFDEIVLGDVMTQDPKTLTEDETLAHALNHMLVGGYRHVPLVRDGSPVGFISIRGILKYIARNVLSES